MPAGSAEVYDLVIVEASRALLLAVPRRCGSSPLSHPLQVLDGGAGQTGQLATLWVVESYLTLCAHLVLLIEVSAGRTGDTLVIHHHLPGLAAEARLEKD